MPRKPASPSKPKRPKGPIQDSGIIVGATVRPYEEAANRYGPRRTEVANLVRRYRKWVYAAVSRTAAGVGMLPVRVMRAASEGGSKSAWTGRRLGVKNSAKVMRHSGPLTTKAMRYDDELEEVTDPLHPVNALLRNVNQIQNGFDWMEDIAGCASITGNAYTAMVLGARGYPVELWNLPPQFCHVQPDTEMLISGYWYGRGQEIERFFSADSIIQFRQPNPCGDPYYGMGDLEACVPDADLSFALSQVSLAILDNGIMPGLIFVGEDWTDEHRKQARAAMEREQQGIAKIGRAMYISGKVKVEKVNVGQYEVELLKGSDEHAREVVAACFACPVELLTLRPGGLSDGKGKAMSEWQTMSLLPRKRRIEDKLNERLMPLFREALGDESLVLSIDSPVAEDEEASERRASVLFTGNLAYRDEARAAIGWEAVDDGKQVWAHQLQAPVGGLLPSASSAGDAIAASASGEQPAEAETEVPTLTAEDRKEMAGYIAQVVAGELPADTVRVLLATFPGMEPEKIEAMIGPAEAERDEKKAEAERIAEQGRQDAQVPAKDDDKPPLPPEAKALYPHLFDEMPDGIEFKDDDYRLRMQAALEDWFRTAEPKVQERVRSYVESGLLDPIRDILANDPEEQERLDAIIRPALDQALKNGNADGMAVLTDSHKVGEASYWVDVPNERAAEWARQHSVRLADSVLATVDERVRSNVGSVLAEATATGLERGETVTEVTNRVAEVMGPQSSRYAAERIARTETARASVMGRVETYQEAGTVRGLRWLPSGDPCPSCQALAGKVVPVGTPFAASDYGPVMGPPLHPFCSCDLTPVFGDSA